MGEIASEVGFVHLRVHSAYSLLEGALPIKVLLKLAAADRQPALGIADTGNLFGALEFAEKMVEKGIQPIIGCQVALDFGEASDRGLNGGSRPRPLSDVVLIAATEAGYWNLVRLVSDSYMSTEGDVRAHLALARLSGATDGLIALTGGPGGPIDRAIASAQMDLAVARLEQLDGALSRSALCRAAAPSPGGGGTGRAASRRPRLPSRPAAGRDQRGLLPGARRL